MYKTVRLFLLVIWIFIAAACVGVLSFFVRGHHVSFGIPFHIGFMSDSRLTESVNETFDVKGIGNIHIKCKTSDISVRPSATDQVHVVVRTTEDNAEAAYAKMEGGTLLVSQGEHLNFSLFGNHSGRIEIELPESYSKEFTLDSSVGDVSIEGDYQFSKIDASTSTGDFTAETLKGKKVSLSASIGDIRIETLAADSFDISNSTGDLTVNKFSGAGSVSSSIGDVRIGCEKLTGDFRCSASTGDVRLTLLNGVSARFDMHTSVGDIDSVYPLSYSGSGKKNATGEVGDGAVHTVNVSTSVGDITLD